MRIAVSTDEHTGLVDYVLAELERRGHDVEYFGPAEGEPAVDWPVVTLEAADRVAGGMADEAVVMCWTGTGCSIVANKVDGVRAALCGDAETARGARVWNHANVLALSLRATPEAVAKEILDRWFETPYGEDDWNAQQVARVRGVEARDREAEERER